jgi:hypothetical protein
MEAKWGFEDGSYNDRIKRFFFSAESPASGTLSEAGDK